MPGIRPALQPGKETLTVPVTTWKGEPVRLMMGGAPVAVWMGNPGAPPVLVYNFDAVNPIYVGYQPNIAVNGNNTQYVPSNFGLTMDGTRTLYAVGANGAGPLQITPGGGAPFQQPSVSLVNLGAVKIFTTTTAPTQPPNIPVNSLWFAPDGSIRVWNGTAWVVQSFSGQEIISANTITAAELAAGIIYAGIVNGTIVEASQFIAQGTQGEFLAYTGAAALGNLLASVSGAGGTDAQGNSFLQGISFYGAAVGATIAAQVLTLGLAGGDLGIIWEALTGAAYTPPGISGQNTSGSAGNGIFFQSGQATSAAHLASASILDSIYGATGISSVNFAADQVQLSSSGGCWWAEQNIKQLLFANPASGPFINGETWHSISLGSGLSGTLRIKLLPWNMVWLNGQLTWNGTGATTITCGSFPSSSYYPTASLTREVGYNGTPSSVQASARLFIPTSGGVQILFPTVTAAGTSVGFDCLYPNN
jgi:hypothetical protein